MIAVKNLVKIYTTGPSELVVLKKLTFSVKSGEFIAITGKSGSGKSTLLYQMSLLDRPTSGEIFINGKPTVGLTSEKRTKIRLTTLGYIFQDYALIPSLTAVENVITPLLMQGFSMRYANDKACEALHRVGLGDKFGNLPSQLSGGQQQRVSIARAISHQPSIIFADEPTANLDTETSAQVLETFMDLHKHGQTIIMVTHEPDYAKVADRVLTLKDGEIVSDTRQIHKRKSANRHSND